MRENLSYIFFKELTGPGRWARSTCRSRRAGPSPPIPKFVPLGAPIFLRSIAAKRAASGSRRMSAAQSRDRTASTHSGARATKRRTSPAACRRRDRPGARSEGRRRPCARSALTRRRCGRGSPRRSRRYRVSKSSPERVRGTSRRMLDLSNRSADPRAALHRRFAQARSPFRGGTYARRQLGQAAALRNRPAGPIVDLHGMSLDRPGARSTAPREGDCRWRARRPADHRPSPAGRAAG